MDPEDAGRRLILLALPFIAFGLFWALRPPIEETLDPGVVELSQALGVALAFLGVGAVAFGVWLVRSKGDRLL